MSLELDNLAIGYHSFPILQEINATIRPGEVTALLGKNGSGKTTLMKSILHFIPILEGKIIVEGNNSNVFSPMEYAQKLSVVLSAKSPSLRIKVLDFIQQGRYPYHRFQLKLNEEENRLVEDTISFLELEQYRDSFIDELSDGNFQKVSISRAIVQDTDYILFDEPLSHLDAANQQMILRIIQNLAKERNKGVLFSTHDWNQSLRIADQLWLIKEQAFYTGSTEDLALQEDLISYFSHPDFYYDYCFNQFRNKKDKDDMKKVQLDVSKGNSASIYWLNQALGKNGIEIEENAPIKIRIVGDQFIIEKEQSVYRTNHISEIIQKIES